MGGVPTYENPDLAAAYEAGNRMPESSLRDWAELIAGYAPRTPADVVEAGSGTGMFCDALVRHGGVRRVLGVEPSPEMLRRARSLHQNARIEYVAGSAESVPATDAAFDLLLLSRVIHHVPDREACAREAARVLRADGVVVIRTTFRECLDSLVYTYWPTTLAADVPRFPAKAEVVADFAAAGFGVLADTEASRPVAADLREYHQRLASRPQSKLAALPDDEFEAGLRRLAADAQAEAKTDSAGRSPVVERYDVLVLGRTGSD
jgi:ubiquinone/menaquinone biosynthesis C-methylase UbiE